MSLERDSKTAILRVYIKSPLDLMVHTSALKRRKQRVTSLRLAWATYQDPVSKNKTKQKESKDCVLLKSFI
jgi:hypothetical protein